MGSPDETIQQGLQYQRLDHLTMGDSGANEALTQYLEGVGAKDLIKEMTLELNDSKPDEPIGHLIKFLYTI